jgi:WD40 repeat protein
LDSFNKIYDLELGEIVTQYKLHDGFVSAVALDRQNRLVASGGHDNAIRLMNLDNFQKPTKIMEGYDEISW